MPRDDQILSEPAVLRASEPRRFQGPAFAALDLGTNNCRMLVATPSGDGFRVLDSFSRIVRLGEGLHHTGELSAVAMERAMAALHACAARLERRPVRRLRAIATEACRRAANGPAFLARVKSETGLDVGVISSREEAELALESCAPLLAGWGRRALLFDIGGGSTELAWVRLDADGRPALIGYNSLPVGVVTLSERFGPGGFRSRWVRGDGRATSLARLASFEAVHCIAREIRDGGVQLLGTSGTVTTLAGVALGLPRYRRLLVDGTVLSGDAADAGAGQSARAGAGWAGGTSLCRAGPGGFRAAGLRGVCRAGPDVAGASRGGGRPRAARGHAAAHDARRPAGAAGAAEAWPKAPRTPRGLSVAVRTAKGRSGASQRWLARQLNDPYVAAARQQGWRSRAAFKLIELDERFHLIRPGARVVDLGAAPGGWTQVAVKRGAASVVAVDLLPMDPVSGAVVLQGDFTDEAVQARLAAELGGKADLVLSDMAPNTTGHAATDHLRIVALAEAALEFALEVLAEGGAFVAQGVPGGRGAGDAGAVEAAFRVGAACQAAGEPEGVLGALCGGDGV